LRKTTGDALVGTDVAHYVVEARLGGGGMGVVYAARDTKLGRKVALKFLPPQWSHDESAKQRFIREAQAASATDHPNICTIHDIGTAADGQLFIVMAHYDGQTLKARLEGGRLPVDEAVDIAAQVAEGLAKAHSQGVIHRDIKPANLMLTEDRVKILDFGLAKFADARLKLTLEGSTIGTIAYMSPEQARGDEADARSDIWAVGVVLYEMLTGDVPFKGGYPEAIAHAIKNDPPAPIRPLVPEVSEALEQLVFRALYKERGIRIQSARELARALRHLQGRTLPLDLRTEPLTAVEMPRAGARRLRPWWASRKAAVASAAVLAVTVGAPVWVLAPVERVPVVVAPAVNQTGYAELDPYRLALTHEVVAALGSSRTVRVLPYDRLLQIVRPFRQGNSDVSSREVMQALATHGGARIIIVPTLLYENGSWWARVEFRNAETATSEARYDTAPVVSSLAKDTAYGLMSPVLAGIDNHFIRTGPRRAYLAELIRSFSGRPTPVSSVRLRTLDAAAAFEQGIDAYEQQEYSAALKAFADAARQDPQNPLPLAWRSRTARIMRHDQEAGEAAQEALRLLTATTPASDRLFIEAVAAESQRDVDTAEARYRELTGRTPDDPTWLLELAAFQDRQGRAADAIATHHRALDLDPGIMRAHLDLCRLYNPNELAAARQHGERALNAYRALSGRAGEAQAFWCLADVRRLGGPEEREQAREHAQSALAIFQELGHSYNLSRAYNYLALAVAAQGRMPEAVTLWDKSLAAARDVTNEALQPLVLMNLGVAHNRLGNRSLAMDYYEQSSRGFEALGLEQRAAEIRANAAAIRIENGDNPEQGLRDVQNALAVSRKLGNRNFEVLASQLTATYHRYGGRHAEAERELNRALNLARERDLDDYVTSLTIDLARSALDKGEYQSARTLLQTAIDGGARTHARIRLGQTHVRLGDFDAARRDLTQAARELENGADRELVPLLHQVMGELGYESGRADEARTAFREASAHWTATLPDPASVEARVYLGFLEALDGRRDRGQTEIGLALDQARKMGRIALEARARLFLARIDIDLRRYDIALRMLDGIPPDDSARTIGHELRAQTHYWRSRALTGRGEEAGAQAERAAARSLVEQLRARLPEADRARFTARPEILRILN
jgi:tetratricopeptide (TPR) repeat protein